MCLWDVRQPRARCRKNLLTSQSSDISLHFSSQLISALLIFSLFSSHLLSSHFCSSSQLIRVVTADPTLVFEMSVSSPRIAATALFFGRCRVLCATRSATTHAVTHRPPLWQTVSFFFFLKCHSHLVSLPSIFSLNSSEFFWHILSSSRPLSTFLPFSTLLTSSELFSPILSALSQLFCPLHLLSASPGFCHSFSIFGFSQLFSTFFSSSLLFSSRLISSQLFAAQLSSGPKLASKPALAPEPQKKCDFTSPSNGHENKTLVTKTRKSSTTYHLNLGAATPM